MMLCLIMSTTFLPWGTFSTPWQVLCVGEAFCVWGREWGCDRKGRLNLFLVAFCSCDWLKIPPSRSSQWCFAFWTHGWPSLMRDASISTSWLAPPPLNFWVLITMLSSFVTVIRVGCSHVSERPSLLLVILFKNQLYTLWNVPWAVYLHLGDWCSLSPWQNPEWQPCILSQNLIQSPPRSPIPLFWMASFLIIPFSW